MHFYVGRFQKVSSTCVSMQNISPSNQDRYQLAISIPDNHELNQKKVIQCQQKFITIIKYMTILGQQAYSGQIKHYRNIKRIPIVPRKVCYSTGYSKNANIV